MDKIAFEKLYNENYKNMYQYAYRLTQCPEISKDIVQDGFQNVYEYIVVKKKKFTNIKSLLYTSIYNVFANQYRKKQHFIDYTNELYNQISQVRETNLFDDNLVAEKLKEGFRKLNQQESDIVSLYQDGFKYREIAEVLGMNPASVGNTLSRAIEKLRNTIKKECHELFE